MEKWGTHDVSYQGKESWIEGRKYLREGVDIMEENNMRTVIIDGNTNQHKQKVKLTTSSKQVPSLLFLEIFVPPRQSKFVLSIY